MTRDKLTRQDEARRKAFAWMDGWACGASFGTIPDKYLQDSDFAAGWKEGRSARAAAKLVAESLYGYEFAVLRLCKQPETT